MTSENPRRALDFYPNPIELSSLDPAAPNRRDLGEGVEVVVLVDGPALSVFRDRCPHMGAPLSAGRYDGRRGTLSCPWHGYAYDAKTGEFRENPNDKTFDCMKELYASYKPEKAPVLKLAPYSYEIDGARAWVRRAKAG